MITMISIALAITITASLAVITSHYTSEGVDNMISHASFTTAGLGLEKIDSRYAFLHGMVVNCGSHGISIRSVNIILPDSTCDVSECALSANLTRANGSTCVLGSTTDCDECEQVCTLRPGESIDFGPSLYEANITVGENYVIAIEAETSRGDQITEIRSVQAR